MRPTEGCRCRKPLPGLIEAAIEASGIEPAATLLVGDDLRDLEAARAAGVGSVLVLTGKGRRGRCNADRGAMSRSMMTSRPWRIGSSIRAGHAGGRVTMTVVVDVSGPCPRHGWRRPPARRRHWSRSRAELHDCFARGNKLLVCGNGGSASDAEHLVAELVGRFKDDRQALPALALSAGGTATLTAVANDYGYETIFARQVEALARPGDLLFAISTSGNSPNVIAAVTAARARDCRIVGFTGETGGRLATLADILISAPSTTTARIQEVHGLCIHAICEALDHRLGVGKK